MRSLSYLKGSLVESIEPMTAAIDGLSFEQVVCVTSAPKNMKTSSRIDDDVNARANETIPLTPPSLALNFCTKFCKY